MNYTYGTNKKDSTKTTLDEHGKFESEEKFVHSSNGSEMTQFSVYPSLRADAKISSFYDMHGNCKEIYRVNNGKKEYHMKYEYTYDSKGNWTKKIEYDENMIPKYLAEREIKYF